MKRAFLIFLFVFVTTMTVVSLQASAAAGGFVPCDGPECQACHLVELSQRVLTWVILTMASVIALVFAWGGIKMVMSAGNTEGVSSAKSMMSNAIVGFVILLAAWLIINTVMNLMVNKSVIKVWNTIECGVVAPPTAPTPATPGGVTAVPPGSTAVPQNGGLPEASVKEALTATGINVVSSGNCTDPSNKTCTGLAGIQQETIEKIVTTNMGCTGCNLQVSGGTEVGHTNPCHAAGTCVDIKCAFGCNMEQTQAVFTSAEASGARAVWEGSSCSTRDTLRAQGLSAYCSSDPGYGHITGTHFSLYTK